MTSPDSEKRGKVLAKVGLKVRIERDVAAIVEDQIELDLIRSRPRQVSNVEFVAVGGQQSWIGSGAILPAPNRRRRERRSARFTVRGARLTPISLPRPPFVTESLDIGI